MPNLVAYDLAGVQPMSGPTGLIFAMRSRFTSQTGTEALFNEADTAFSGTDAGSDTTLTRAFSDVNTGIGTVTQNGTNPSALNPVGTASTNTAAYTVGQGMPTGDAESLDGTGNDAFNQMAFSIEKVTVTAKSRALKAEYSLELAQDLKAIHGLNAEAELANILSTEILAEINREVIRTIYMVAEQGAVSNTSTAGNFDLDIDSNGRWSVEKFKGLLFQIERDANAIAQRTRRGKGNMILCSADVASALTMAGILDYTPALNTNLNVDDTGNTFAGTINGKFRVYIDPYSANLAADNSGLKQGSNQYYVVGYKGGSPYEPYDEPEKGKGPFVPPPGKGMMISGNPSFDINETPATRRTRKIRTLQERGVGGEKGNAGDILKKGIQLPNIQAKVNYGTPSPLDKYWQKTGYPSRNESDEERLRKVRGSIPYA